MDKTEDLSSALLYNRFYHIVDNYCTTKTEQNPNRKIALYLAMGQMKKRGRTITCFTAESVTTMFLARQAD